MDDKFYEFVCRVANLKSIPEGVTTSEILNTYNELVTEARQLRDIGYFWWNNQEVGKPY